MKPETSSQTQPPMPDPIFERNSQQASRLLNKHVAFVGCGSGGGSLAVMAARAGVGRFTLVDPDVLTIPNLGRHMLGRADLGKPKVEGLKQMILDLNPIADVLAIAGKFEDLAEKPDLIVAGTDSFECEAQVNDFALRNGVPAVYCGCWGAGAVGEILYVVPGRTPCFQCYAAFRQSTVDVPEIVPDERKYTDPDFDSTRVTGQPGLFANILTIAGIAFQVCLALLDDGSECRRIIDYEHTLLLFNLGKFDGPLQPLAVTFGKVEKGCAVCDSGKLAELVCNGIPEELTSADRFVAASGDEQEEL
jgi:molybdopterin/thiamine biosynthesis adenylyltransferase